jgi:formylglycine-generating enzyme required for sulfatase activity
LEKLSKDDQEFVKNKMRSPGAEERAKPPLAKAPFDAAAAKQHQKDWAVYLGKPVVITNSIGMRLVLIAPGEFLMGSAASEDNGGSEETGGNAGHRRWRRGPSEDEGHPQHRVRITKPFYMGVCEVRQAEYEQVMGDNPSFFSRTRMDLADKRVLRLDTRRFPVEEVFWEDAVEFCRQLSVRESRSRRVYRLPTEAEWEYGCRAGTTTPFHFGDVLDGRQANCNGSRPYGASLKGPYLQRPTTVGTYSPNAFGLHDMHGNVSEWCRDRYDRDYYKESPVDDPRGPVQGSRRVGRGGSWVDYARTCKSSMRYGNEPRFRSRDLGFRVVLVPPGR